MCKILIITYISVVMLSLVAADVSHLPVVQQQQQATPPVTEACLGCICEAMSECKQGTKCEGDVCGLFRMTWSYWADAGKPTLNNELPTSPTAYQNCANDPYCAATAVQGYMTKSLADMLFRTYAFFVCPKVHKCEIAYQPVKYGQDCNGDGKKDCRDYMLTHYLGGYNCRGSLPPIQGGRFEQCLKQLGI